MSVTERAVQRALQAEADRLELAAREKARKETDALKTIQNKTAKRGTP